MKLTKHYELEMTAEEIKALAGVQRTGGLANKVLDLMLGKFEDEPVYDEDLEEDSDE